MNNSIQIKIEKIVYKKNIRYVFDIDLNNIEYFLLNKEQIESIKNVFELNWVPYFINNKTISFYKDNIREEDFVLLENKIKILFKKIEKEYFEYFEKSISLFEQDKGIYEYDDYEYLFKYHKETNDYYLICKTFENNDVYKIAKSNGDKFYKEKGVIHEVIDKNFMNDYKHTKKYLYFKIKKEGYLNVKNYFEEKLNNKNKIILEEQKNNINKKEIEALCFKDDILGLEINFDSQIGCFKLKLPYYTRKYNKFTNTLMTRNVLGCWVLNNIYSENIKDLNEKSFSENDFEYDKDSYEGMIKRNIKEHPQLKDKECMIVSVAEIESIKKIVNSYNKQKKFFDRKKEKVEVNGLFLINLLNSDFYNGNYPLLLIKNGKPLFIYKRIENKKENKIRFYGYEITKEELFDLYNKPYGIYLKNNHKIFQTYFEVGGKDMSKQKCEIVFNKLMLNYELENSNHKKQINKI